MAKTWEAIHRASVRCLALKEKRGAARCDSALWCSALAALPLRYKEVDEEGKGCDPHERLDLGGLALKERDDHVGDKAQADSGRDGVGEGHAGDNHERRETLRHVGPVDLGGLAHHKVADVDQSTAGGGTGNDGDDGGEERGENEQHAGGDGGEARAATVGGARSGLDEGGDGGDTHETAHSGGGGVDD